MLHICPRLPGRSFVEPPFKEEILAFLRFLGHSGAIRRLTDVNINKLHQPCRSFAAIINKCLTKKSSGNDSLRLNIKIRRRAMRCIILGSQSDASSTIVAIRATPPKPKASVRKTRSSSDTIVTPPIIVAMTEVQQLKLATKRSMQQTYISQASGSGADKGTEGYVVVRIKSHLNAVGITTAYIDVNTALMKLVLLVYFNEKMKTIKKNINEIVNMNEQRSNKKLDITWRLYDTCGVHHVSTKKGMDIRMLVEKRISIVKGYSYTDVMCKAYGGRRHTDEGTGSKPGVPDVPSDDSKEEISWNSSDDEDVDAQDKDRDDDEGNKNDESDDGKDDDDDDKDDAERDNDDDDDDDEEEIAKIDEPEDTESGGGVESIFTTASSSVAPLPTPIPTMTPSIITTITTASHPLIPPTPIPSEVLQNLPKFDSVFRFNKRLKSLEATFSEYRQTNLFAEAVSNIPGIVHQYMNQQLNEARIIKEQVKSQVKEQVSRILPRIKESVNAQLEAEVLTRSFHSSQTSYAVAADLSEMELKKILIEKMEGNKEGGEPESARAPLEPATKSAGRSTTGFKSRHASEPVQTTSQIEEPSHPVFETESTQTWITELAKQADSRSSFNELLNTPLDFSNFIMNRLGVDTLTPELLARPTYELMRGSCNSMTELEYHLEEVYKATTDQLDWVNPEG
nr:hypothetical protein [Tanacetum cinerariifolium]